MFLRSGYRAVGILALAVLTVLPVSRALGDAIPMTAALVVVDAERNGETGQFAALFPTNTIIKGRHDWELDGPRAIVSRQSGAKLADLESLGLTFDADPGVSLEFSVRAGPFGTNFTITSAVIAFAPIAVPQAYATAAVTATDRNLDTATLTGLFAGNKAYEAYINGGIPWATLVSTPLVTPVGRSASTSDRQPAAGWQPVGVAVSSISSAFKFHLTPLDSASGTSMFEVVEIPEPATLALLGLGWVMTGIRRRR